MVTSCRTSAGSTTPIIAIRNGSRSRTVAISPINRLKTHPSANSLLVVTPKPIRYAQHVST
eukprot:6685122-Prorocentrum_lima.AAC.1